ncbi:hypothetical protein V8C26DRAFT_26977 [Trichoderma gracile]
MTCHLLRKLQNVATTSFFCISKSFLQTPSVPEPRPFAFEQQNKRHHGLGGHELRKYCRVPVLASTPPPPSKAVPNGDRAAHLAPLSPHNYQANDGHASLSPPTITGRGKGKRKDKELKTSEKKTPGNQPIIIFLGCAGCRSRASSYLGDQSHLISGLFFFSKLTAAFHPRLQQPSEAYRSTYHLRRRSISLIKDGKTVLDACVNPVMPPPARFPDRRFLPPP